LLATNNLRWDALGCATPEAETAYYNKSRWEPQLAAVPSGGRVEIKI
jgi:hypothetical protein